MAGSRHAAMSMSIFSSKLFGVKVASNSCYLSSKELNHEDVVIQRNIEYMRGKQ